VTREGKAGIASLSHVVAGPPPPNHACSTNKFFHKDALISYLSRSLSGEIIQVIREGKCLSHVVATSERCLSNLARALLKINKWPLLKGVTPFSFQSI